MQFSTKVLATYMAHPCMKALAALKHLASYLEGSSHLGILLRQCDANDSTFDRWSEEEIVEPDFHRDRSILTLDAFSDSSWGDERSTRRSTTSGMVFANGCLILSICRAQATLALSSCEAELYAANSTMVECIYLHQLAQFLVGSELDVRQRLFLDSSSAKFVVQRSGVGKLKHVEIKHMFLQQLLRQGIFTIHKIPTRVNPADLNTKKLSVERRKLLSTLCGLYPICAQGDRDEELVVTRRVQRNMARKLVQALQVVSMSLLQGCSHDLPGKELHGLQALRGGEVQPGYGPVQALCASMSSWWTTFWTSTTWWTSSTTRIGGLAMAMVAIAIMAMLVSMVPRRGRGAQQGGRRGCGREEREEAQRESSEEHFPIPSDAGDSEDRGPFGDDHIPRLPHVFSPEEQMELMRDTEGERRGRRAENRATGSTERPRGAEDLHGVSRRSRTTSRERGETSDEVIAALHRKIGLLFMTIVEGNYIPRRPVTSEGILTTLKHLLAASFTLDSGSYVTLREAFNYLDGPNEHRAKRLLNDLLYTWERQHGRLPDIPGDLSRLLLRRYSGVIRDCGFPVLRLEEKVYGPDYESAEESQEGGATSVSHCSSYSIEVGFNEQASRSHDSETMDVENGEDRLIPYRASSMGSVTDPDFWMHVHHFESDNEERPGDSEPGPLPAIIQRLGREAARTGEPRPGGPRDPLTYPPIQQDDILELVLTSHLSQAMRGLQG